MEREIRELHGSDVVIETDGDVRSSRSSFRPYSPPRLLRNWPAPLRMLLGLLIISVSLVGIVLLIPVLIGALVFLFFCLKAFVGLFIHL